MSAMCQDCSRGTLKVSAPLVAGNRREGFARDRAHHEGQ